jgi:stress-induced morphogen
MYKYQNLGPLSLLSSFKTLKFLNESTRLLSHLYFTRTIIHPINMPPPFPLPVGFFDDKKRPKHRSLTHKPPLHKPPAQLSLFDQHILSLPHLQSALSNSHPSDTARATKFAKAVIEGRLHLRETNLLGWQDTPITNQAKWHQYHQKPGQLQRLQIWHPKFKKLKSLNLHQQINHNSLVALEKKITTMQFQARGLKKGISHEPCWEKWELLTIEVIGSMFVDTNPLDCNGI